MLSDHVATEYSYKLKETVAASYTQVFYQGYYSLLKEYFNILRTQKDHEKTDTTLLFVQHVCTI